MGRDKSALFMNGQSLLERAVKLASEVAETVAVVGPREKYGAAAVEDIFPGQGPLAGIHAALSGSKGELNLVLAVDLPFVTAEFLRFLIEEAGHAKATVTLPVTGGRLQPLCAVYRREFAALAEAALRAGRNKIDPLFGDVIVRRIDEAAMVRLAFDPQMFDNLNTPEDYERAVNERKS